MRTRELLALLLAALIGVPVGEVVLPNPATAQDDVKSLEEQAEARRRELQDLHDLLDQERARLAKTAREERSVLDLLHESEIALEELAKERVELERRISALRKSIRENRRQLAAEREKLEAQRERMERRLVGLYKLGPAGSLRVLLSSGTVGELERRRRYMEIILRRDREQVEEFRHRVERLERIERELAGEEVELRAGQVDLERNREKTIAERETRLQLVRATQRQREAHEQAVRELASQSEELEKLLDLISRRIRSRRLLERKDDRDVRFASFRGSLLPPVEGRVLSRFGRHVNKRFGTVTFNNGIEIAATPGKPVEAVFSGIVIFAERFKGYGKLVIIDHGEGYYSLYAHCDEIRKKVGDPVEPREVVAVVGETGSLRGPTLYFEIRLQGKAIDPGDWLLLE